MKKRNKLFKENQMADALSKAVLPGQILSEIKYSPRSNANANPKFTKSKKSKCNCYKSIGFLR